MFLLMFVEIFYPFSIPGNEKLFRKNSIKYKLSCWLDKNMVAQSLCKGYCAKIPAIVFANPVFLKFTR